ncbi:MAG: phosphoribosylglycinamide formyltransferase [Proteobacteria bacterium]|nr:phosphoribosylglycinamide formyltransferase [Pseudomonadota bacterium]
MKKAFRIGVMASGSGTNFGALAKACADIDFPATIGLLLCNRRGAGVLSIAEKFGLPTALLEQADYDDRKSFDTAAAGELKSAKVELVVMAGFDRLVTPALLDEFPGRIINIHPAILPAFRGVEAQAQAAEYGVTLAGATVHFVDRDVDHGPIIVQAAVPVLAGSDAATLRKLVLTEEHRILPWAVKVLAEGRVSVDGRVVKISGASLPSRALTSPDVDA